MALNLDTAIVEDGALVVGVHGDHRGKFQIRAEVADLKPVHGGVSGANFEAGHQYGGPYLMFGEVMVRLTREQEESMISMLGVTPLPDAPSCPRHGTKMDALTSSAWECPTCRAVIPEAVPHVA